MVFNKFTVRALTHFVEEQSDPSENRYVFSYTITIENNSEQDAQLFSRKWIITDANGKKAVITGEGVVGEQPVIKAGSEYSYTSGAVIDTPVGAMQGHYEMQNTLGDSFIIEIPAFRLATPNILH